jgi:ubiquinone/menaquinone biosynthesis C-methylase UbiE
LPEWDELFKQEQFRWRKPDRAVAALARELKQRRGRGQGAKSPPRVLDLGFGAGRHVVYLAREGFEVCGTDVSPRGLALTNEWLRREGLEADLKISDMTVIPYPDGYFDGLISTYVIHHNTLENIRRCVAEIYRVLAPGGQALLIVQSKRGYRYRCGQEIEPDTLILNTGADAGVPHHFFDRAGLRELLCALNIRSITAREHTDSEGHRHAHWKARVEKPQRGQVVDGVAPCNDAAERAAAPE